MSDAQNTSDPVRHPTVRWSRLKSRWPFLVWTACALMVLILIYRQGGTRTLAGVVEKELTEISALELGLIQDIAVEPGQEVQRGDLLAVLDTAVVDAELAAAETARKLNARQMQRQFDSARFQAETDLNGLRIDLARDEAELKVLVEELKQLESLLARRLIDGQLVTTMRARRDALTAAVNRYPIAIKQLEEYMLWAEKEKEALLADLETDNTQALALRKGQYRLVAAHAGRVSEVFRRPGEVVSAREVILTVVREQSRRVIALVPEDRAAGIELGRSFKVQSRMASRGKPVPATLVARAPEIIGMPQQSVLVPGRVVRGRRVILEFDGPHSFLPGEAVVVRAQSALLKRASSTAEAVVERPANE